MRDSLSAREHGMKDFLDWNARNYRNAFVAAHASGANLHGIQQRQPTSVSPFDIRHSKFVGVTAPTHSSS